MRKWTLVWAMVAVFGCMSCTMNMFNTNRGASAQEVKDAVTETLQESTVKTEGSIEATIKDDKGNVIGEVKGIVKQEGEIQPSDKAVIAATVGDEMDVLRMFLKGFTAPMLKLFGFVFLGTILLTWLLVKVLPLLAKTSIPYVGFIVAWLASNTTKLSKPVLSVVVGLLIMLVCKLVFIQSWTFLFIFGGLAILTANGSWTWWKWLWSKIVWAFKKIFGKN